MDTTGGYTIALIGLALVGLAGTAVLLPVSEYENQGYLSEQL